MLPNQGGKVCSCFCLFPLFIPPFIIPPFIFTPGCGDGAYLEQPADLPCSHLRLQSRLLPWGSPVIWTRSPSSLYPCFPWETRHIKVDLGCWCPAWGAGCLA